MTRPASFLRFLSLLSFLLLLLSPSYVTADSHFEGFEAEEDDVVEETIDRDSYQLTDLPLTRSDSPPTPIPDPMLENSEVNPSSNSDSQSSKPESDQSKPSSPPSTTSFDYWDEDEFEGLPVHQPPPETPKAPESTVPADNQSTDPKPKSILKKQQSYTVEIVCVSFLIMFIINYFTGKRENENLALSWAAKFATKDSIFEKNFSLLGVGEGEDSPLLSKEGQNVFKFYASGRRYCQGLLATMKLKSRHDLIARICDMIVPCKDEITFEVCMNDDAMDHVIFALAKKKAAKGMQKEVRDLQRFAGIVAQPPSGKKWVSEELGVISESKEVAGDLITEAVLEQVRLLNLLGLAFVLYLIF